MQRFNTPFVYTSAQSRVVFGAGSIDFLTRELDQLGLNKVLIVGTAGQRAFNEELRLKLGGRIVACFSEAVMHTPVSVTNEAMSIVESHQVDGVVAVGGGSSIGLSKAIAFRTGLPQVVIPTTYAGSEMTAILGETENELKVTKSDPKIRPKVVIYDVNLTTGLPVAISVTSGMNAIAHAVEALYAHDTNPVIATLAEEGVRSLVKALPLIAANPEDLDGRSNALYGAWLCGICLGSVSMAIHHKLCHTLGGTFNLPHAETHTALLPHALAYNAGHTPQAIERLRRALDTISPAQALYDLAKKLGAQMSLKELGMPEEGIQKATELAFKNMYPNPRTLEPEGVKVLITHAWQGKRPL
ncbi:maleylacetate reductase [Pseudomonas moorei]|uniref:Alcohol dehydrogenase, class IV n=1 Tax=Pseudomonas moorei TaxID=395599 RepID=A0A1H1ID07_9PSED|nr:maleylacetate reductase [Pseudomonas moorei]KAB0508996.1 maleylacetate reductase [Pseudomonas moorei]SDR35449.1 Alcohol dehydrogenase, class IV [Pseudomonas moorei]